MEEKIKKNAIASYFMIIICVLFLFAKKNKYLNNDFVRSHAQTAFFLHIAFLISWFLFVHFKLFNSIIIFSYNLNYILASFFFILLFGVLLYGAYKASKGVKFTTRELVSKAHISHIIDINENAKFNEKDKLTIILSYIPFISFIIYGKYIKYSNKILVNSSKLSMIVSLLISFIYIFSNDELANILILLYMIFIVFCSIMLIVNNKLIIFNLEKVPDVEKLYFVYFKGFIKYIYLYIVKRFKPFKEVILERIEENTTEERKIEKELKKLKDYNLPKYLNYIPFINLFNLFFWKPKQRYHIINGLVITTILGISWYIYGLQNSYNILILFPIFYGIGYSDRLAYRMPIIFDLYLITQKIIISTLRLMRIVKHKRSEEHSVSLKVEDK